MPLCFAPETEATRPLYLISQDKLADWRASLPPSDAAWVSAMGFEGKIGQTVVLPDGKGGILAAAAGFGTDVSRARARFHLAAAAGKLPAGSYRLETDLTGDALAQEALGWLMAGYRFDRYHSQTPLAAQLVAPAGIDAARVEAMAAGEALTRDLINTPASDMGPQALERAVFDLAIRHGATATAVRGDDLLAENFPMIHAVGRAAAQAPRLLDLRWGGVGPKLTLVGKGVCFDTGGLDLKPSSSMLLMKKDMGGAATVLGLAHMIMSLGLPVQLRVLIPAVENAVAGNAFRPGDILTSRLGKTVEINNTDAEGRLVLADALTLASEEPTDLIVSMATLTGAARVAVGPDLAPFFTDDDGLAAALFAAAPGMADPVWRMPFHTPYEPMIEPGIADLDNAPSGGFAGAITAALFLRRFVQGATYAHFDIYGWAPKPAPARGKGGFGQGARALLAALGARWSL
ncbi:M17 family metallopeptidase [Actibacterium sp.]|uniref:leucyl aminopeptidase family protein n=1 Tax=Actibacterium sp. TaxID=1872125 RepID=UPI003565A0AB